MGGSNAATRGEHSTPKTGTPRKSATKKRSTEVDPSGHEPETPTKKRQSRKKSSELSVQVELEKSRDFSGDMFEANKEDWFEHGDSGLE